MLQILSFSPVDSLLSLPLNLRFLSSTGQWNQPSRMNTAFNYAHKAAVGTLVFFSVWGTYSVAGGTGIVIKRRWDRKYNTDNTLDQEEENTFLTPVQPTSLPDLDSATIKRVD